MNNYGKSIQLKDISMEISAVLEIIIVRFFAQRGRPA